MLVFYISLPDKYLILILDCSIDCNIKGWFLSLILSLSSSAIRLQIGESLLRISGIDIDLSLSIIFNIFLLHDL